MNDPMLRVQAVLDALQLGIQIRTFEAPTGTAQEAAAAIGCELGAIVKSLCFLIDERPVLVLAAGDKQVDSKGLSEKLNRRIPMRRYKRHRDAACTVFRIGSKALRRIFNVSKRQVKIADAETVRRVTGFEVGGVVPIGHLTPLITLIDRSLSPLGRLCRGGQRQHHLCRPIPDPGRDHQRSSRRAG